ncbi:MAG: antitoxin family protein [Pseudomonadota bacterium]
MTISLEAVFDGEVLRPERPPNLPPNTRVIVTIEPLEPGEIAGASFLRTARGLNLEGPPDLADRVDEYLYGAAEDAE